VWPRNWARVYSVDVVPKCTNVHVTHVVRSVTMETDAEVNRCPYLK